MIMLTDISVFNQQLFKNGDRWYLLLRSNEAKTIRFQIPSLSFLTKRSVVSTTSEAR